jgi:hypothetical protein
MMYLVMSNMSLAPNRIEKLYVVILYSVSFYTPIAPTMHLIFSYTPNKSAYHHSI